VGGRITVQQEKISTAERSWTNPSNALQEAIPYSFIKFCMYCFSLWYEFFVHCALTVEKKINMVLTRNFCDFSFFGRGDVSLTQSEFLSLCFGVTGKTPGLIYRNNFVKEIFVCIGHRDVLARSDSIFPLLRDQGVWNKTCTQRSLPQILFQNPKNYSRMEVHRFYYHS
jgi:hypothetical protein